jgi:hypothetical protein
MNTQNTKPEPWEYAAAMRELSRVGWARLSTAARAVINAWEGRGVSTFPQGAR